MGFKGFGGEFYLIFVYSIIDSNEFCLEDLKWVVLMVLFNVPGKEKAYAQMEDLLFEEPDGVLH